MGKDGKKGLGMGLGALFGEEYPSPQPEHEETAPDLLPIEKIEPRGERYIYNKAIKIKPLYHGKNPLTTTAGHPTMNL